MKELLLNNFASIAFKEYTPFSMNTGPDFGGSCWICHKESCFQFTLEITLTFCYLTDNVLNCPNFYSRLNGGSVFLKFFWICWENWNLWSCFLIWCFWNKKFWWNFFPKPPLKKMAIHLLPQFFSFTQTTNVSMIVLWFCNFDTSSCVRISEKPRISIATVPTDFKTDF